MDCLEHEQNGKQQNMEFEIISWCKCTWKRNEKNDAHATGKYWCKIIALEFFFQLLWRLSSLHNGHINMHCDFNEKTISSNTLGTVESCHSILFCCLINQQTYVVFACALFCSSQLVRLIWGNLRRNVKKMVLI